LQHSSPHTNPEPSRCRAWYQPLAQIPALKLSFKKIIITFIVNKSNLATEPHSSPQGYTVRPQKGVGQCSMGVVWVSQEIGEERLPKVKGDKGPHFPTLN